MTDIILSYTKNFVLDSIMQDFSPISMELQNFLFEELIGSSGTPSAGKQNSLPFDFSIYQKTIPIVYGTVRVRGYIIWTSQPPEQFRNENESYEQPLSIAIGICEGVISGISTIWINNAPIKLSSLDYEIHYGEEDQEQNQTILSNDDASTAYRGLAYIVVKNFDISRYKNKFPTFDFEVTSGHSRINENIESICISNGKGEDIYQPNLNKKIKRTFDHTHTTSFVYTNCNNLSDKADILVSLEQLQEQFPNVKYLSLDLYWVSTSADAQDAKLYPSVEYPYSQTYYNSIEWRVGNYSRYNAYNTINLPAIGTPSDSSIKSLVLYLKKSNHEVAISPKFIIDTKFRNQRWFLTGSSDDVCTFIRTSYSDFILHYADIIGQYVDCFIIGSELTGITTVTDKNGNYKAVDELVILASKVRNIIGKNVLITYAAGAKEYHSHNGFYHMDKLWASQSIDIIGINAFFPLTDLSDYKSMVTKKQVLSGWESGPLFDYVISGEDKLYYTSPSLAPKNIQYWWENSHTQPDGAQTRWIPKSKKIWFTEFGFPSIDLSTNNPNSVRMQGLYSIKSSGRVNFDIQRLALEASLSFWMKKGFVEKLFVSKWNPIPYPFFPDLENICTEEEENEWYLGYDINGKVSRVSVYEIVRDILLKVRIKISSNADVYSSLAGFLVNSEMSARDVLLNLNIVAKLYIYENNSQVYCTEMGKKPSQPINYEDLLVINNKHPIEIIEDFSDLPSKLSLTFFDRKNGYLLSNEEELIESNNYTSLSLKPYFVSTREEAKRLCQINIFDIHATRRIYKFSLSNELYKLSPGSIISIEQRGFPNIPLLIKSISLVNGVNNIIAVSYDQSIYSRSFIKNTVTRKSHINSSKRDISGLLKEKDYPYYANLVAHSVEIGLIPLDIPLLYENKNTLYFALFSNKPLLNPCSIFVSSDFGETYRLLMTTYITATYGYVINNVNIGPTDVFDYDSKIIVKIESGSLLSVSELSMLNNNNIAIVGSEIIQFCNASLSIDGTYTLSKLIRGKMDTETTNHNIGEMFILISSNTPHCKMHVSEKGKTLLFKAVPFDGRFQEIDDIELAYRNVGASPLRVKDVKCEINHKSGNIMISWKASSQLFSNWVDYIDYTEDDKEYKYIIKILDKMGSTVRESTISETYYEYTSAARLTELSSDKEKFFVNITEFSIYFGPGKEKQIIVEPDEINILNAG